MADPDTQTNVAPAEKVRSFPATPGLYLMKDAQGRVIYVGKAKNLRSGPVRTFTRPPPRIAESATGSMRWRISIILAADSEVDALLMEARLIKDIQPKYNHDLKDDKSFPYLQITTGEDFPRVNFTREPRDRGVKLYGPFPRAKSLRGAIQVLQRDLQVPHLLAGHRGGRRALAVVPALPAGVDQSVHGALQPAHRPGDATVRDIRRLRLFLDGKKEVVLKEMEEEMREASKDLQFEKAARLRDEIKALQNLEPARRSGQARPARGLLRRSRARAQGAEAVLGLESLPRTIDGVDIAHLGGTETVARWSRSSTACHSSRDTAATRSRPCRASMTSPRSAK